MTGRIEVLAVTGLPEVRPGDDLAALVAGAVDLVDGDVVVVTQKVVSKAEDRLVDIDPEVGFFYIILCLAAGYGCDTGAYFVGRAYGRRKLAPAISPNKTLEGALGGLIAGALGAVFAKAVFDYLPGRLSHDLSYSAAVIFGIVIAAAGIVGDLVESLLKRDAEVKDAGRLLPGVGGVLDRVDSALLAIPVTYYLLLAYYYLRLGV